MRKIAIVDMDNTLVDYTEGMRLEYDALCSPNEENYEAAKKRYEGKEWPDHLWQRIQTIYGRVDWWYNLEPLSVGFEIVEVLKSRGYEIHVGTSGPSDHPRSWMEKYQWVKDFFPKADAVHITRDKSILGGQILVDDWPDYITKWQDYNHGGFVVVPAHHYNKHLTMQTDVLRYENGMQGALHAMIDVLEGKDDEIPF